MIRLLRVECRRDLTRDLTRWLVLMFVIVTTVGIVIAWFNVDGYSDAESARIEADQIEQCSLQAQLGVPTGPPVTFLSDGVVITEGPTGSEVTPLSPAEAEAYCRDLYEASLRGDPEGELFFYADDPRPNALDVWNPDRPTEGALLTIQTLLLIGGLGAAASMIGAEWKAGTITTQLTWTPQRVPVLLAKLAAAAVLAATISYLLQIWFTMLTFALVVGKGGVTAAVDGEWLVSLAGAMGRVSLLVGMAAVIGASLATIFRNTAGAILVVFGYMAVVESLLRVWQPDWDRWFIGENMSILLSGRPLEGVEWVRGPLTAGLVLALYIGVLAAGAAASFQRRDIAGTG
jgi:hypothetical protein